MYIISVIKNIFAILDKQSRWQYLAIQLFFFIAAFLQVLGIASIGPFISILSNQDIIHNNEILAAIYNTFQFDSNLQFIIFTALASLILILISNTVAGISIWLSFKYSVYLGSKLQRSVYRNFLKRDYLFHKMTNYNDLVAIVAHQIPRFVYMLFQPFLLLTSQLFVAIIILIGLVYIDPILAIIAAVIVGGSYLTTYIILRKSLSRHGHIVTQRNEKIQGILSESFVGIKDVKLNSLEYKYIRKFDEINYSGLSSQAFIALSGDLPKFVIESISFGAILILALVLLTKQSDISIVVPVLSIYALAGYKLLPTMQQIYKSLSSISGHGSVAMSIREHIEKPVENIPDISGSMIIEKVNLDSVTFTYPSTNKPAVNNVSIELQKGVIYSLAGHSGSGKSTLADLILGLLKCDSGNIRINDKILDDSLISIFRQSVSYVAQNIFILEDSVLNNVVFGNTENKIDIERVNKSLEMAGASDFVNILPKGVNTNLGQDGKLLSGGQRQRIGIARSLYKKSNFLILDEPTSGLDIESEYNLMKTLNDIKHNLIVLIISHRPTSIKMSDRIILMDNGVISAIDDYDDLLSSNDAFKKLMAMSV